jgi:glycosyltransferase involved in cell wall biosynthesis
MKISVVIPLYNKRDTVLRALNSVLMQTVRPFEVIVVDDGSTDGSGEVVTGFKNRDIRLIAQTNAGVSSARNRGIAEAEGDWIAFLDADDEWLPDFLGKIISLNARFPQCFMLATSYHLQNFKGIREKAVLKKIAFKGDKGLLNNYFEVASHSHPPVCSSAVVIKRNALLTIGCFPVGINSGEDLVTWAKLALNYQIGYSIDPCAIFYLSESHELRSKPSRPHDDNDSVGKELTHMYTICTDNHKRSLKKYISHWYKMRASVYLRDCNIKGTWKSAFRSLKINPLNYKLYGILLISLMPARIQKNILGFL